MSSEADKLFVDNLRMRIVISFRSQRSQCTYVISVFILIPLSENRFWSKWFPLGYIGKACGA